MTKPKFEWPCDKRRPHLPHDLDIGWEHGNEFQTRRCPGVRAHPLTQIGGHYQPEEIDQGCLCVFEGGEIVRTDGLCQTHSKRPGVRNQED